MTVKGFVMSKWRKQLEMVLPFYRHGDIPLREKVISAATAGIAIFLLLLIVENVDLGFHFKMLVLASMGASAFLLFVVPHSPLAQPWPVIGGHLVAAFVGVACAHWLEDVVFATATAVLVSVFMMHIMHCLHPPSAATAMIAVLGGPEIHAIGWQFCYEVVLVNAGLIVLLAVIINNMVPGRFYPMRHHHHPHHAAFSQKHAKPVEINEQDFKWALSKMDGFIDVSEEDLVDLYEFALEHAQTRKTSGQHKTSK